MENLDSVQVVNLDDELGILFGNESHYLIVPNPRGEYINAIDSVTQKIGSPLFYNGKKLLDFLDANLVFTLSRYREEKPLAILENNRVFLDEFPLDGLLYLIGSNGGGLTAPEDMLLDDNYDYLKKFNIELSKLPMKIIREISIPEKIVSLRLDKVKKLPKEETIGPAYNIVFKNENNKISTDVLIEETPPSILDVLEEVTADDYISRDIGTYLSTKAVIESSNAQIKRVIITTPSYVDDEGWVEFGDYFITAILEVEKEEKSEKFYIPSNLALQLAIDLKEIHIRPPKKGKNKKVNNLMYN